jgi:hypothetical protein
MQRLLEWQSGIPPLQILNLAVSQCPGTVNIIIYLSFDLHAYVILVPSKGHTLIRERDRAARNTKLGVPIAPFSPCVTWLNMPNILKSLGMGILSSR